MSTTRIAAVSLIASMGFIPLHAAHATVITETGTISDSTFTDSGNELFLNPGGSSPFTYFDPALGTLNSVAISITLDPTVNGTFANNTGMPVAFTFTETLNSGVGSDTSVPAALNSFVTAQSSNFNFTATPYSASVPAHTTVPYPATGANDFPVPTVTESETLTSSSDPSDLATFESAGGPGFDILIDPSSNSNGSSHPGNFLVSVSTYEGGTATISYDYTPAPVPEPATLALLGTGLLGLLAVRRRFS